MVYSACMGLQEVVATTTTMAMLDLVITTTLHLVMTTQVTTGLDSFPVSVLRIFAQIPSAQMLSVTK